MLVHNFVETKIGGGMLPLRVRCVFGLWNLNQMLQFSLVAGDIGKQTNACICSHQISLTDLRMPYFWVLVEILLK